MNREDIINIVGQVVKDMAYIPGMQINSFAIVDNGIDLKHTSFNKTYEDFNEGNCWSRTWVNGGADPNAIQGEFPLLFIEQKSVTMDCIDDSELTYPFYFVLADKISCDGCPPEMVRTSGSVMEGTLLMMRMVFKELLKYRRYPYIKDDKQLEMWAPKKRMKYLEESNQIDSFSDYLEDFESMLESKSKINISQWGNFSDIRAHSVVIPITVCDSVSGEFDYTATPINKIAHAKCSGC